MKKIKLNDESKSSDDDESSSMSVDECGGDEASNARCAKRKSRTTFSKIQLDSLEQEFSQSKFVNNDTVLSLASKTGLEPQIIKVQ